MQKCVSTLLAILLLFGGSGMVFGQHFCEGIVVDKSFAIGFGAMSCADVEAEDSCENNPAEDDCCTDTYYQLQTDKEFSTQWHYVSLDLPQSITSESVFFFEVISSKKEQNPFNLYTPPDWPFDKLALYQIYLI